MGMIRVLHGVPQVVVQAVRPGDDELEIVPGLFPEHVERFLAAHHGLDQLLPEEIVVLPGFHRVDIDLVAGLFEGAFDLRGVDGLGQVDGHEAADHDAVQWTGRIGRRLVDDDRTAALGAQGVPDGRHLEVVVVGEAQLIRFRLEVGEAEDAVRSGIGPGHEVGPADRRYFGEAGLHFVQVAGIDDAADRRHDTPLGKVQKQTVGDPVQTDDANPVFLFFLEDSHGIWLIITPKSPLSILGISRGQVLTFNKVDKEIENNIVKSTKTSFFDIFDPVNLY